MKVVFKLLFEKFVDDERKEPVRLNGGKNAGWMRLQVRCFSLVVSAC